MSTAPMEDGYADINQHLTLQALLRRQADYPGSVAPGDIASVAGLELDPKRVLDSTDFIKVIDYNMISLTEWHEPTVQASQDEEKTSASTIASNDLHGMSGSERWWHAVAKVLRAWRRWPVRVSDGRVAFRPDYPIARHSPVFLKLTIAGQQEVKTSAGKESLLRQLMVFMTENNMATTFMSHGGLDGIAVRLTIEFFEEVEPLGYVAGLEGA